MNTDPHQPLRDDVRLLGTLLGDTLREQEGDDFYDIVERVRALAKGARQGHADDFGALQALLQGQSVDDALTIARAFAHLLTLANIAEQHHRIRRRRYYQRDPKAAPQRASFGDTFAQLRTAGVPPDQLHAAVCTLAIELVFTAHPTEIVRRTLAQKQRRIADLLGQRDRADLTLPERDQLVDALRAEITASWWTNEINTERPTPLDEVRAGLVVFEQTLWNALPQYLRMLDRELQACTGHGLPPDSIPIRFGSWIGGDRDGNPNVTATTTAKACLLSRWMAADLYLREISLLRTELSLREGNRELHEVVGNVTEPYRALLRTVCDRLRLTRHGIERLLEDEPLDQRERDEMYWDANQLAEPLDLCRRSLEDTGVRVLATGRLLDIRRRVRTFGLTLVRLDIRQESAEHTKAIAALTRALGLGDFSAWDEPRRQQFLTHNLQNAGVMLAEALAAMNDGNPQTRETLDTFRAIAAIRRESLGAYVISMARSPSDVLAVQFLQAAAGVAHPLRVVPLFETVDDLRGAASCLATLFSIPEYRTTIGGRQEVMIGYSDSAKDGGRLAAAWELYRAQETIVATCHDAGVHVTLFHGRGGTVGRGGGPTHLAIQSQPPGSIRGSLRVTEQGEMINAKFGLSEIALRTLELYTTATLLATLRPPQAPLQSWRDRMQVLADVSRESYRKTVYHSPDFVDYFRAATPEVELGELKIGSRPARRKPGTGVRSLRAIPWVFAWTQTRLMLPAWLGVGAALDDATAGGFEDELAHMYQEWPFFRSTIDLIEMVLAKSSPGIAQQYDARLVPEQLRRVGDVLREQLHETARAVLAVTGHEVLLADNPVLRRSIDVRNPYVDPINLVQAEILCRLRRQPDDERLLNALLITVNGIAAGMRNTG